MEPDAPDVLPTRWLIEGPSSLAGADYRSAKGRHFAVGDIVNLPPTSAGLRALTER